MACLGAGCPTSVAFRQEDFNRWAIRLTVLSAFLFVWSCCYPTGLRGLLADLRLFFGRFAAAWSADDVELETSTSVVQEPTHDVCAVTAAEHSATTERGKNQKKTRRQKEEEKSRLNPNRTEELLAALMASLNDVDLDLPAKSTQVVGCSEELLKAQAEASPNTRRRRSRSKGRNVASMDTVADIMDVIKPALNNAGAVVVSAETEVKPVAKHVEDASTKPHPVDDDAGTSGIRQRRDVHDKVSESINTMSEEIAAKMASDGHMDAIKPIKPMAIDQADMAPARSKVGAGLSAPKEARLGSSARAGHKTRRALASPTADGDKVRAAPIQCLLPCEHAACDWVGPSEDLEKHVATCEAGRMVSCAFASCSWTGLPADYEKHVATCGQRAAYLPEAKAPKATNAPQHHEHKGLLLQREAKAAAAAAAETNQGTLKTPADKSWTDVRSSSTTRRARAPAPQVAQQLPPGAVFAPSPSAQRSSSRAPAAEARARSVGAPGARQASPGPLPARSSALRARSEAPTVSTVHDVVRSDDPAVSTIHEAERMVKTVPTHNIEVGSLRSNAGGGLKAYSGMNAKDPRPLYQDPFSNDACDFPTLPGGAPPQRAILAETKERAEPAKAESYQSPARLATLEAVFSALDTDRDGYLVSSDLHRFARLTGFDGDTASWKDEYNMLCREHGVLPRDGLNRKTFSAVVDANSEEGCPCTDSELKTILRQLHASTAGKAVVVQSAPEVAPPAHNEVAKEPVANVASKVDPRTSHQKQADLEPVAAACEEEELGFWEEPEPAVPEVLVKVDAPKHVPAAQPKVDDAPTRSNRFGKPFQRAPLIKAIFIALDLDADGLLCCEELRHFAEMSGFDGSDEEWGTEFRLLSEEWNTESSGGIDQAVFAEMVNERSNSGCYCTDQELQAIGKKLPHIKVQALAQPAAAKEAQQKVSERPRVAKKQALPVETTSSKLDDQLRSKVVKPAKAVAQKTKAPNANTQHAVPSHEKEALSFSSASPTHASAAVSGPTDVLDRPSEAKQEWSSVLDEDEEAPAAAVPAAQASGRSAVKAAPAGKEKVWMPSLGALPQLRTPVVVAPQAVSTSAPAKGQKLAAAPSKEQRKPSKEVAFHVEEDEWEELPPAEPAEEEPQQEEAQLQEESDREMEGEEDGNEEAQEFFLNTCGECGETWLLALEFGEEFVCEEAGKPCGASASKAAAASFSLAGVATEESEAEGVSLRSQLLRRVLSEDLTTLAAADIFLSRGLDPPKPAELEHCRVELRRRRTERAREMSGEAAREADRLTRKKQQRYLDGKLVEVSKGTKFVVEPKESAEERQKTSCSIVIIGSKARAQTDRTEKKGPRS